jgi:hypothetical protein
VECLAGLKRAVLWTLALTALSLVVAAFSLLSWAHVPALIGLLYIRVGVVAAPLSFLLGGMSTDSYGLVSRSNDLFCTYMCWCFILFPVTPIVAGCLLCLGVHHVLVYLLPGLCPVMIGAAMMVIDLTNRAQQLWESKRIVSADPLGVPLV